MLVSNVFWWESVYHNVPKFSDRSGQIVQTQSVQDLHCLLGAVWSGSTLFAKSSLIRVYTVCRSSLIRVYTVCHSMCIFLMHFTTVKPLCAAPVAEWLRSQIFSALNRSSSHHCRFKPSLGHMWDKPSSACWWSGGFSRESPIFAPTYDWLDSKWVK